MNNTQENHTTNIAVLEAEFQDIINDNSATNQSGA